MTRLLLVSGKGGVGKTTLSAATAVRAAARGLRTLVVSVDRAHNLGDVLATKLGPEPTPVPGREGLWAMEADPQRELHAREATLQGYFSRLLTWAGVAAEHADEVAVIPGLEELLVLARLSTLVEDDAWELVVVDLAPTASSLRLLSFPELMEGALGRFARLERSFLRLTRPAFQKLTSMPVPEDRLYESLEALSLRLGRLRRVLLDPARTTVRLASIPERVVIDETRSAFTLMSLFGLAVDGVVLNRVLPQELEHTSLAAWVRIQAREIARAREAFPGVPVRTVPFQGDEVLGVQALGALAQALYGDDDPLPAPAALPVRFEGDELTLALAHHDAAGALELLQQGDELIITLGAWRRRLLLPASLSGRTVRTARLTRGALHVDFHPREEQA